MSCVPSPHSPIFRCGQRRRQCLRLPPTSTVSCLIVVCCRSSSLIIVVLIPFSSSRSLPAPAPHSSAPATISLPSLLSLSHLFDCCVHPIRRTLFLLRRYITNVQSGHRHRRHHCRHRCRLRGHRCSGVHSAGDGRRLHRRLRRRRLHSRATMGNGRPPRRPPPSFSVAVVRIFSLLAASPSRPRIFASTVASPPLSPCLKGPPSPRPKGLLLCGVDGVGRCRRRHHLLVVIVVRRAIGPSHRRRRHLRRRRRLLRRHRCRRRRLSRCHPRR